MWDGTAEHITLTVLWSFHMPDGYVTELAGISYCNQTLFLSARVGSGHKTSCEQDKITELILF